MVKFAVCGILKIHFTTRFTTKIWLSGAVFRGLWYCGILYVVKNISQRDIYFFKKLYRREGLEVKNKRFSLYIIYIIYFTTLPQRGIIVVVVRFFCGKSCGILKVDFTTIPHQKMEIPFGKIVRNRCSRDYTRRGGSPVCPARPLTCIYTLKHRCTEYQKNRATEGKIKNNISL